MSKTQEILDFPAVSREQIEVAIRRAHQMRNEAIVQLFRQFGSWLRRTASAALAWRPGTAGQVVSLNR